MISNETARKTAIKFFRKERLDSVVEELNDGINCLDDIFDFVVRSQGKLKAKRLFLSLPKDLRQYLVFQLEATLHDELFDKISALDNNYEALDTSPRPEKLKCFPRYIQKKEAILMRYFDS